MDKFCIFCGNKPTEKNKEHVLPKWLIELTDYPERLTALGRDYNKEEVVPRIFPLKALTFPACKACNSQFGHLEKN